MKENSEQKMHSSRNIKERSPTINTAKSDERLSNSGIETSAKFDVILFLAQVFLIYGVVIVSLLNLTLGTEREDRLWIALLSSSIGYILPNPRLKFTESILPKNLKTDG